jgi:hypothetical protein
MEDDPLVQNEVHDGNDCRGEYLSGVNVQLDDCDKYVKTAGVQAPAQKRGARIEWCGSAVGAFRPESPIELHYIIQERSDACADGGRYEG